jgi:hypothetical protein
MAKAPRCQGRTRRGAALLDPPAARRCQNRRVILHCNCPFRTRCHRLPL